jgi:hypothetical protein
MNLDQGLLNGRHHPERTRTTRARAEVMNLKAHLLRHRRLVSPASGRRSSSPVLPRPCVRAGGGDGRSRFRSQASRKLPRNNICVGRLRSGK